MSDEEEQAENVENLINFAPNEKVRDWVIVKELGKGQFGKVYHVLNTNSGKEGAMKVEYPCKDTLLKMEAEVIGAMAGQATAIQVQATGRLTNCYFLVMTICGPDLTKVSLMLNNTYSESTILRVSILTLFSIKALHEVGYVHRDLKPCNMALGYQKDSTMIYLLDFGMARKYAKKSSKNVWMIRYPRTQPRFRGTLRYCSMNMHKRIELGRVDDLWSWFYMMIEMKGELPWAHATHPDKVEIMKKELLMPFMNKHPTLKVFFPILDHLNTLTYPDRPDYLMMYNTIKARMDELNVKFSDSYDFDKIQRVGSVEAQEIAAKNNITIQNDVYFRDDEKIKETLLNGFTPKKEDLPGGVQHLMVLKANFLRDSIIPHSPENDDVRGAVQKCNSQILLPPAQSPITPMVKQETKVAPLVKSGEKAPNYSSKVVVSAKGRKSIKCIKAQKSKTTLVTKEGDNNRSKKTRSSEPARKSS